MLERSTTNPMHDLTNAFANEAPIATIRQLAFTAKKCITASQEAFAMLQAPTYALPTLVELGYKINGQWEGRTPLQYHAGWYIDDKRKASFGAMMMLIELGADTEEVADEIKVRLARDNYMRGPQTIAGCYDSIDRMNTRIRVLEVQDLLPRRQA